MSEQPGADGGGPPVEREPVICSARGCRAPAVWVLLWNNPTLHSPDRRKTWAACDEHRGHLAGYLRTRDFLRDTVPLADWERAQTEPGSSR